MYILLLYLLSSLKFPSLPLFPFTFRTLSLAPHSVVPSAIPSAVIQVDEDNDVVMWQPPAEPNGVIQYYNIRISRYNMTGGEEVVQVVPELTETHYGFSTLGLSAGTYVIQVGSLFFFLL